MAVHILAAGPQFSTTVPFAFQLLLAGNMAIYLKTRNFDLSAIPQLGLFLFMPFVAQWSIGNFITASGVGLWGCSLRSVPSSSAASANRSPGLPPTSS